MSVDGPVTSRRHPVIARLRAAARREGAEVLLDGPHLLEEALRSPRPDEGGRCTVRLVVATHAAVDGAEVAGLCDAATAAGIPVRLVPHALASAISPARTPTGVVALAEMAPATLAATLAPSPALVVVLAGLQDPGNVGTIIRTAEAAGATGVILLPGSADPFGWKALRASMGSALRVPLYRAPDDAEVQEALDAHGVSVIGADSQPGPSGSLPNVSGSVAVLVGAEGAGLPADWLAATDARVRIDMAAPVESLNAAIATAVLLFEIRRLRHGRRSAVEGV